MAELEIEQNLHGDAKLLNSGRSKLDKVFDLAGSTEMPLGHAGTAHEFGLCFDVNRDKQHALTIGRSRGGKGVSSIIPALLTYKGSMVVIDPKGENAWITAQRRRDMGQRVVILDPWNEVNRRYASKVGATEEITRFNPLSALDPEHPDFADDVSAIAEAFILQTGNDPHWPDSARELVGGFIASEVQRTPGKASIKKVRKLLSGKLSEIMTNVDRTIQDFPDSVGASKLAAAFEVDEEGKPLSVKEMASIRSTARTQTAFLDSKRLVDSMETDEPPFNLEDLATQPTTLYLVLPVDKLKTHGRWLRMILTLAIRAISRLDTPPDPPVVFMLDELGTISPGSGLSMVEQSYGLMAGLGIRIWAFLQDLPQLKRDYPESWETFISNSSVIQLLNVADNTTSSYFSQYLGNKTVRTRTGEFTYKQAQWKWQDSEFGWKSGYDIEILERLKDYEKWNRMPNLPLAIGNDALDKFNDAKRASWKTDPDGLRYAREKEIMELLKEKGMTRDYVTTWVPDEQLASRPIMFPWEVEKADESKCIIIRPGKDNYQLKRFVYYSDPALKPFARLDPKFPDTPIVEPPAPAPALVPVATPLASIEPEPIILIPAPERPASAPVAAPVASAPIPPQTPPRPAYAPPLPAPSFRPQTPANDHRPKPPASVGDELADLGKEMGKKAAGAAVSFLKDRLKR